MMVNSQQLLLLSLLYGSHVVFGVVMPSSKVWESSSVITSTSHAAALVSNSPWAVSPMNVEQHHSLSLNVVEPAMMQVYNHGPDGSRFEIYDFDKKIGETGSNSFYPTVIVNTSDNNNTSVKVDMDMVHLSMGNHELYLEPSYYGESMMDGSVLSHSANVRLLPTESKSRKSRLIYRNSNFKETPTVTVQIASAAASSSVQYNAFFQLEIDPDHPKQEYKYKKEGDDEDEEEEDYDDDDDDEDDDDDDDEDDDDDDDDEDEDEDEDGCDEEKYHHKEYDWDKKEGWKQGKKKNQHIYILSTVTVPGATTTVTAGLVTVTNYATTTATAGSVTVTNYELTTTTRRETIKETIRASERTTPPSPECTAALCASGPPPQSGFRPGFLAPVERRVTELVTYTARRSTVTSTLLSTTIGRTVQLTVGTQTLIEYGSTLIVAGMTETVPGATLTIDGLPITFIADTATDTVYGTTTATKPQFLQKLN